jgi:hypothetical protein
VRIIIFCKIFDSITVSNDLCFQLSSDKQSFNSEKIRFTKSYNSNDKFIIIYRKSGHEN